MLIGALKKFCLLGGKMTKGQNVQNYSFADSKIKYPKQNNTQLLIFKAQVIYYLF